MIKLIVNIAISILILQTSSTALANSSRVDLRSPQDLIETCQSYTASTVSQLNHRQKLYEAGVCRGYLLGQLQQSLKDVYEKERPKCNPPGFDFNSFISKMNREYNLNYSTYKKMRYWGPIDLLHRTIKADLKTRPKGECPFML